jgi:hypothetical protein
MLLLLPFYFLGYSINALPLLMAHLIARQLVNSVEFYAPVRLLLTIILWPLYYILVLSIAACLSITYLIWAALLLPICGLVAVAIRNRS